MKPRVRQVIVVEGRYDKNALLQVVDAVIVETGGFSVFHDREKLAYLRRLAAAEHPSGDCGSQSPPRPGPS